MIITVVSLWAHKLFRPDESQLFGGAELQVYILSKEFAKYPGVKVQFITRGQGSAETFESDGIEVHKLPYRSRSISRSIFGSLDLYRKLKELPSDVYLQRAGGVETGFTGAAAKRRKKPFLFMTCHQWDVDRTNERNLGLVGGWWYRHGLENTSFVITQTEKHKKLMLENYGKDSLVLRSAHLIPESIPTDKKGVLWVARCEPWKGPEAILDLAETMPDVSFTMVCPRSNEPELFANIASRAEKISNLHFIPGVPFDETESLFASHKILLNTSLHEGYPNTYIQSFKWGTPVVSQHINPDGILDERRMGMQTGDKLDDLAAAIRLLLNDKSRWNECSKNAREYAKEQHDSKVIAGKVFQILSDLHEKNH